MSNFIHHHSSSDPNIIRRSRGRRAAEYLLVALIAATVGVGAFIAPARAGDAHSGYASCAAGCHYIIDPLGDQTDPHDNPQGFCLRHNPDTDQMEFCDAAGIPVPLAGDKSLAYCYMKWFIGHGATGESATDAGGDPDIPWWHGGLTSTQWPKAFVKANYDLEEGPLPARNSIKMTEWPTLTDFSSDVTDPDGQPLVPWTHMHFTRGGTVYWKYGFILFDEWEHYGATRPFAKIYGLGSAGDPPNWNDGGAGMFTALYGADGSNLVEDWSGFVTYVHWEKSSILYHPSGDEADLHWITPYYYPTWSAALDWQWTWPDNELHPYVPWGTIMRLYVTGDGSYGYTYERDYDTLVLERIILTKLGEGGGDISKTEFETDADGRVTSFEYFEKVGANWKSRGRVYKLYYDEPGKRDKVRAIVGAEDAQRMYTELGQWPDAASESEFLSYANAIYDYSEDGSRITSVSSGACCGGSESEQGIEYLFSGEAANPQNAADDEWVWAERVDDRPVISSTVQPGFVTTYYYNKSDLLLYKKVELYDGETLKDTAHTFYEYDSNGRVTAEYTDESLTGVTVTSGSVTIPVGTEADEWWDSDWDSRRKISFDNSSQPDNLLKFPVLVKLDSSRIDYAKTQNSGQDIRFVDADGTALAHEIEVWDETGDSYVWVKVLQVDAASTVDYIWMYYDNDTVGDGQSATGVWDDDYMAVWHLHDDVLDSTSNDNDGNDNGPDYAVARIAKGKHFDGSDDNINAESGATLDDVFAGGGTIEAWINLDTWGEGDKGRIVDKLRSVIHVDTTNDALRVYQDFSTQDGIWETPASSLSTGTWHHVVVVYDHDDTANDPVIYIDGVSVTVTEVSEPQGTAQSDASENLFIGMNAVSDRAFDGKIDEVRVSTVERSNNWIKAQHLSMTDGFIVVWDEQDRVSTTYTGAITATKATNAGLIREYVYDDTPSQTVDGATVVYSYDDKTVVQTVATIDGELPAGVLRAEWIAKIKPEYTETYTIKLAYDGLANVFIDDRAITTANGPVLNVAPTGDFDLTADEYYELRVTLVPYGTGAGERDFSLSWSSTSQTEEVIPEDRLYSTRAGTGFLQREQIRKGTGGTTIVLADYEYLSGVGPARLISKVTRYPDEDSLTAKEITTYAYEFYEDAQVNATGTWRVKKRTATVDLGGGNELVTETYSDGEGRPTWSKNANGSVTFRQYDSNGRILYQVRDIDTSSPPTAGSYPNYLGFSMGTVPTGFTTTSGLNLVTGYTYDAATGGVKVTRAPDDVETHYVEIIHGGDVDDATTYTLKGYDGTDANTSDDAFDRLIERRTYTVTRDGSNNYVMAGPVRRTFALEGGQTLSSQLVEITLASASTGPDGANDTVGDVFSRTDSIYSAAGQLVTTRVFTEGYADSTGTPNVATALESTTTYDAAGRLIEQTDAGGISTFYTYGYATINSEHFIERRVYPHDADSGPIQVSWTDILGRGRYSFSAALDPAEADWDGDDPAGDEDLVELGRTSTTFDWRGRTDTVHSYHNFDEGAGTLDFAEAGAASNYYETKYLAYDNQDRLLRMQDAMGNISATVYDSAGRAISQWLGTDDTAATRTDPGNGASDLEIVSKTFYDTDGDGTGDPRSYVTRTERLKPSDSLAYIGVSYEYDSAGRSTTTITDDPDGAGSLLGVKVVRTLDAAGRSTSTKTYKVDTSDVLLARTDNVYDDAGRLDATRVYSVVSGTAGDYLETEYFYDDAGRQVKVASGGGGFTKTEYDAAGRVVRSVFASAEGTNTDADAFTDDVVLTETVFTYDDAGNVTQQTFYERRHDKGDTPTGKLSGQGTPRDNARISYSVTWYDNAHRPTHTANYGTNGDVDLADYDPATGGTQTYSATPPAPNSHDEVIVTKITYDAAGRQELITDNLGIDTKSIYDALGRRLYLVENYADFNESNESGTGGGTGNADDRVTRFVYNADGQIIEQTALDTNGDGGGTNGDDQTTKYIYSSELTDKGSTIKSNSYLRAIIYPDSDDGVVSNALDDGSEPSGDAYDRIELTYFADGSLKTRKDQRENVLTFAYHDDGRRKAQQVTTLDTGGTDGTVRSMTYAYDNLGRLTKVTSHGNVTDDPGNTADIKNQVTYEYNGLGQLTKERQDHDSVVDAGGGVTTRDITYTYETTSTVGDLIDDGARLLYVTYPNGRQIHRVYSGHGSIDDAISRVTALAEEDTVTANTPGSQIVAYGYLGSGRLVKKGYPIPEGTYTDDEEIALDYTDSTGQPYDVGFDRFGRVLEQHWTQHHDPGDDDTFQTDDLLHISHGYDRASNRLYAARQKYTSHSEVYGYDNLHRLSEYKQGLIKTDNTAVVDNWVTRSSRWTLDQLGNQQQIEHFNPATASWQAWTQNDHNKANEITARRVRGDSQKFARGVDLFEDDATEPLWNEPDEQTVTSDRYDIDTTTADQFRFSTIAQDTYDTHQEEEARAFFFFGGAIGEPDTNSGNHVFGYNGDLNDYYLNLGGTTYHVDDGAKSVDALSDGHPGGRIGLYATAVGDVADFYEFGRGIAMPMTDRWSSYQSGTGDGGKINGSDQLDMRRPTAASSNEPHLALLRNVRARYFEATFAVANATSTGYHIQFVFNVKDEKNYDIISVWVPGIYYGAAAPSGEEVIDGTKTGVSPTGSPSAPAYSSPLWYCVRVFDNSGTDTLEVRAGSSAANARTGSVIYTSTDYNFASGGVGFAFSQTLPATVDDLTITLDRDADGVFTDDTVHSVDTFDIDGSGYGADVLEYDKAGNLTYDGLYQFTYDAWNRLVQVDTGYPDTNSDDEAEVGTLVSTMQYDGLGRRIVKAIRTGGDDPGSYTDLDGTYHYYYDGQQQVEERNGSQQVIRQTVWSLEYIDALAQIAINDDPGSDDDIDGDDQFYFALHNANYNVMGLVGVAVEGSGGSPDVWGLVERYEYTPYGERSVFTSAGTNDPDCFAAASLSARVVTAGGTQNYYLNPFGHQGLIHDEVTGLIHNGARVRHPRVGIFIQRDPLGQNVPGGGYHDGMNLYQMLRGNPINLLDPWGLSAWRWVSSGGADVDTSRSRIEIEDYTQRFLGLIMPKRAMLSFDANSSARHSDRFAAVEANISAEFYHFSSFSRTIPLGWYERDINITDVGRWEINEDSGVISPAPWLGSNPTNNNKSQDGPLRGAVKVTNARVVETTDSRKRLIVDVELHVNVGGTITEGLSVGGNGKIKHGPGEAGVNIGQSWSISNDGGQHFGPFKAQYIFEAVCAACEE